MPRPATSRVRARREARICNTRNVVEYHAPRALEKATADLVVREIEQPRNRVAAVEHQVLHQLRPPLAASRRREHRIEHDRAVIVEAHPVVRKHRVRAARLRPIVHRVDDDSRAAQCCNRLVELHERGRCEARVGGSGPRLEPVAVACFDVPAEGRRSDHHRRRRALPAPSRDQVAIRVPHVREFSRELPERVADVGH